MRRAVLLLALAGCDSSFFDHATSDVLPRGTCPDYVVDVRELDAVPRPDCLPEVEIEARADGCWVDVRLACVEVGPAVTIRARVTDGVVHPRDEVCSVRGEWLRCKAFEVRIVEPEPLPYAQTGASGWVEHDTYFQSTTQELTVYAAITRRGYYQELLALDDGLITFRNETPNIIPVCPGEAPTQIEDPEDPSRSFSSEDCLFSGSVLDGSSFVASYGQMQTTFGIFERRDGEFGFDVVSSVELDPAADCGRDVPTATSGFTLDRIVRSVRAYPELGEVVAVMQEIGRPIAVGDKVDWGSYIVLLELAEDPDALSIADCRFFPPRGESVPRFADAALDERSVYVLDDATNEVARGVRDLDQAFEGVSLDINGGLYRYLPEISVEQERAFVIDIRGTVATVLLSDPVAVRGATPFGVAHGFQPSTMVRVGDLYAVGLYAPVEGMETGAVGEAWIGWFDPEREAFLPGATPLSIPQAPGVPTGLIGRLVVKGDRLYALLSWTGAVVELAPTP